jgi:RNA polymerase sporulation-specific sigma factor
MPVTALASLSEFSDEELAVRFQAGDAAALELLLRRYCRFARAKTRVYFLVGADADDVEQEVLIGLFKAARDYRAGHQSSFRAFAELCATRQVISAIKAATRLKHQPLNRSISISGVAALAGGPEGTYEEVLEDRRAVDPADEVVRLEQLHDIGREVAQSLSGLEAEVLRLYTEGKSYQEIGERLGRHIKSIDNALQRIKRKLEPYISGSQGERPEALVA